MEDGQCRPLANTKNAKIFLRHTQKPSQDRYAEAGMFNFGAAVSQDFTNEAFTPASEAASAPMTLTERVHSLFEQLRIPVFRYVMRKTRDSGRAEEITQETFLRLFRHLKEERAVDNPKAWLFTVANNLAIDAGRGDSHIQDLDETTWNKIEDR